MNAAIVYLCTDLLFTSKIRETAQALGHTPVGARDVASLLAAVHASADAPAANPTLLAILIDLRRPDALQALDALSADEHARDVPRYGFCDHELTDRMQEARQRGCVPLAKGKFSSDLKRLIAG
jgi:hypothetical protein